MKKNHTYLARVLIGIDQLGNALAGGNEDCTISGRLGYLYLHERTNWTTFLMLIVDFTFRSVDGNNHCYDAYMSSPYESYLKGHAIGLAVLGVLVIVSCVGLFIPVLIYSLFQKNAN